MLFKQACGPYGPLWPSTLHSSRTVLSPCGQDTAIHWAAYLSEFRQLLLQVEELKHPQPQSNQGHQNHEKHHKETQACAVVPPLLQRWQW